MSSIITTAELAAFMDKTLNTSQSKSIVNAINQWIETQTGRCWGDTVTVKETYDWKPRIWLRHQDVRHVSSIKFGYPSETQVEIVTTSYRFNSLGRVSFLPYRGSRRYADYPDYLEITYTYGTDEVPDDLKLAALGIASGFYNWATSGQREIVASQVGSYRVEYAGSSRAGASTDASADTNFAIIASYKTKRA